MAHQTNIAMQTLFKLNMVCRLENLLQTLYAYMPTSTKALKDIWNSRSLLKSWKLKAISCEMSKQGGFLCWNLQRG
jgi:hypothetical protein